MRKYKCIIIIWLILLLCISLHGINFNVVFFDLSNIYGRINIIPLSFMTPLVQKIQYMILNNDFQGIEIWYSIKDFVLNICLFLPFGFLIRHCNIKITYLKTVLQAFIIVFVMELIELVLIMFNLSSRIIDINDIIAALTGVSLGFLLNSKYNRK